MRRPVAGLAIAFVVAFLGWLSMSLIPPGPIVGLAILIGPVLLAFLAGFVSARWLGLLSFVLGYICAYLVYHWIRPLAYLGENWEISTVLYVVIPTILGFVVGLRVGRYRRAAPTQGLPREQ